MADGMRGLLVRGFRVPAKLDVDEGLETESPIVNDDVVDGIQTDGCCKTYGWCRCVCT